MDRMNLIKACIFDLDGVLVDTAHYHFLAWERLAAELGFEFTTHDNEALKGVSRMASLDILLEKGNIIVDDDTKNKFAERKNRWYVEYIERMNENDLLPGVAQFLNECRERGLTLGLGSASKNAKTILTLTQLIDKLDVVVDGTCITSAKPDPEVFLLAARQLGVEPQHCVVFEDAVAGVEAAKRAGMYCVGVGNPQILQDADTVVPSLQAMSPALLDSLTIT
jgi:beta-phosphoglucomutase